MPYIDPKRRDALWNESIEDRNDQVMNAGELNYFISYKLDEYIQDRGLSYQTFNDIIGALESAKLEIYSRLVRPYEDIKLKDNGDVYRSRFDLELLTTARSKKVADKLKKDRLNIPVNKKSK